MKEVAADVSVQIFGRFMEQVVTPVLIGIIILAAALYLFPFLVALFRRHKDKNSIFLINLLLGWTIVGWIWALVWAAGKVKGASKRSSPKRKKRAARKRKRRQNRV